MAKLQMAPLALRCRQHMRQAFVYVVCGNEHAERVNTSLKFLKKFTHKEIVVIGSRIRAKGGRA